MLTAMIRPPRALFLLLFVSCASPLPFMPLLDGGGGGAGGAPLTTAVGGAGGSFAVSVGGSPGFGGSGGSGSVDGDAGADAGCSPFVETYMPACAACLGASCCGVATACVAVSDCIEYASCQQNCPAAPAGGPDGGTNVCLSACAMSYPMAQPAFGTMIACLHQSCAGACPY